MSIDPPPNPQHWLPQCIDFNPSADFESFLQSIPAKWVVYLFTDEQDRPVQLLCVKNLRQSLKRRLGGEELIGPGPSKRVNYRDLVRRIYWRRVDSAFEADWVYYEAARVTFPQSYRGMLGFHPTFFIHVNADANFPRYTKTNDLQARTGLLVGPLEDKHAAARLIQLLEDAFDLCRYYHILVQSPNAKACAYKEMGKCPAPCDGSISMDQYRHLIDWSARTLLDPVEIVRDQTARMTQAAKELRFETAAKIKSYAAQLSQLGKGAYRHARNIGDFAYITLQRGPYSRTAKVFLITPGQIREMATLLDAPEPPAAFLRTLLAAAATHTAAIDTPAAERIGLVSHHLFLPKASQGSFIPLADLNEKSIVRAYNELLRQKLPDESEGEGVLKELQAL